ncbi:MAG: YidC/Oxa1 family membrane protein insertase [Patescibacteria group bacterium]
MFKTYLSTPLYNALIYLSDIIPGHSIGLAIIALTLIIKLILLPLYHQMWRTQQAMKAVEPELKIIKEKYKGEREEQARQTMALYKKYKINPFSGVIIMFIQLPVLLALFYVFKDSINLHPDLLYSFVKAPTVLNTQLFGVIDLAVKSYPLALMVGLTQFIQISLSMPYQPTPAKKINSEANFGEDFKSMMGWQMRYIMPVFIIFVSLGLPSAVTIYWVTSNLFSVGHELIKKYYFIESPSNQKPLSVN